MAAKSGAPSSQTRASPASRPSPNRFKGVRMRSWGKWVSEIRLPNTRARLWLGSFATAQQAARAFDVAVVCLRGRSATLNFPDSPPVYAPLGLPHHQIQELATAAAAAAAADFSASAAPSDSSHSELETSGQSEPSTTSELAQSSSMSSQSEPAMTPDVVECLSMCRQSEPAAMTAEVIACSSPMSEASLSISSSSNCESTDSPATSSRSYALSAASADDVEVACSSSWQEMDSLEGFLRLDEDAEQECLQAGAGQRALSNMGFQWDELLWGPPLSPYSACGQQFSVFPLLPPEDDMAILVEPSLWNLY